MSELERPEKWLPGDRVVEHRVWTRRADGRWESPTHTGYHTIESILRGLSGGDFKIEHLVKRPPTLESVLQDHPRFAMTDGTILCQEYRASLPFDNDEEYAKHVAQALRNAGVV